MSPKQKPQVAQPDRFVIGRRTFFDMGPRSEFYEIFSVRATVGGGTLLERIQITPPADACIQPATVQFATSSMDASVADLLGRTNPCAIPQKDLRRELKRCRKCLVFSGADVAMQVQCGDQSRRLRMDILDRDMFDLHPATPEHTSWTIVLLGRLDQALGSTVTERPAFPLFETSQQPPLEAQSNPLLEDLERGKFDALFDGASDRPSELVRQAQKPAPPPLVS
jgi:hypothetical protein